MFLRATLLILVILAASAASANEEGGVALEFKLKSGLEKRYPGTRIEIIGVPKLNGESPAEIDEVVIDRDDQKGRVRFRVGSSGEWVDGHADFAAWMPAWVASRRIHPGEALKKSEFKAQEVDVAKGLAREYRGVILSIESELEGLEARQTILEGQFALATAVQKIPDVKRGDVVRLKIITGGVTLTTTGTAQEPGYQNELIRVTSSKTKQDLSGKLKDGRSVEVRL